MSALKDFWAKLTPGRRESSGERAEEWEQMSPEEQRFIGESVEDRAADGAAESYLGGFDPNRLLDE